jgi:hypothetical protein
MKITSLIRVVLALTGSTLLTGCLTHKLWKETESWNASKLPAVPNNLQLYEDAEKRDFLVVYDQLSDRSQRVRVRAYYLYRNEERINSGERPRFTSVRRTRKLTPLPILVPAHAPQVEPMRKTFVVSAPDATRFTLHEVETTSHLLPIYDDGIGTAKRIALTPLTATADTLVFGIVLGVYATAHGAFNDVH